MFAASKTDGVVAGGPPPSGDPYWSNVSLLTNFENNLTFRDESTNNFAITRNGTVNPSLNSPFTGGVGGSEYFNGSTGYVTAPDNAALNMGASDFTLEAWIYLTATPGGPANDGANVINKDGKAATSWAQYNLFVSSALKVCASFSSVPNGGGAPTALITGSTTLALNTWYHVAVTRIGVNGTVWVNGSSNGTTTSVPSTLANGARALHIGYEESQAAFAYFPGYISNARIVKGTAVYTANFTPPTAPLTAITNTSLLITGTGQGMFNNSTFVDQGPNALTVTATGAPVYSGRSPFGNTYPGSVLFSGTGQYLTVPLNAALNPGTGNFTLECWVYFNALNQGNIFDGSINGLSLSLNASNQIAFGQSNVAFLVTDSAAATTGSWFHVVAVRSGTTLSLFKNGTRAATVTNSTSFSTTAANRIGWNGLAAYFNGFISNLRIVKGTAVYDPTLTTLTVPTAPLTAITNTSLLVRGDTGAFYDLSNNGLAETGVGSPVVTTQIKKYGLESGFFNGTNSYLSVPNSTPLQLNNSTAFTLECWIYPTVVAVGKYIMTNYNQSSPYGGYGFGIGCDNFNSQLQFWDGGSWRYFGAITANTWTHIAITYQGSGTTGLVFVNGVQQGSAFTVNANISYTAGNALIGAQSASTGFFSGYLDDIRITKGVARYTANFTPPTATFPTGS